MEELYINLGKGKRGIAKYIKYDGLRFNSQCTPLDTETTSIYLKNCYKEQVINIYNGYTFIHCVKLLCQQLTPIINQQVSLDDLCDQYKAPFSSIYYKCAVIKPNTTSSQIICSLDDFDPLTMKINSNKYCIRLIKCIFNIFENHFIIDACDKGEKLCKLIINNHDIQDIYSRFICDNFLTIYQFDELIKKCIILLILFK